MKKEEIYNALKEDGAKLRPIRFYKIEALRELYVERFGEPAPQGEPSYDSAREHDEFPPLDSLEKHDADSATGEEEEDVLPEDEMNHPGYRDYAPEPAPEPAEPEVEIHTLYFTGGGWCNETGTSYAPGYYRPKTAFEYLALRRFAAKEL